jgi:hypothetical protein
LDFGVLRRVFISRQFFQHRSAAFACRVLEHLRTRPVNHGSSLF